MIKFQEGKIKILENMLIKLEASYNKLIKFIQTNESSDIAKSGLSENSKKARIVRPIKGNSVDQTERSLRRLFTLASSNQEFRNFRRQNTTNVNDKDIKFRAIESGLQLQSMYNQQLKSELDLMSNERNSYKSLYSNMQNQYMEVYNKEKTR